MTLIQRDQETKEANMDGSPSKDSGKSLRPVRNRRYTRLVDDSLLSYSSTGILFSLCVTYELSMYM